MKTAALLLISFLGGVDTNLKVDMNSMDDCLSARLDILKQDPSAKTYCIPRADEMDRMRKAFGIWLHLVETLKDLETKHEVWHK